MDANEIPIDAPPAALLMLLRPRLSLAWFPVPLPGAFWLGQTRWYDLGWTSSEGSLEGEIAGFYDWLRDGRAIRGVRFCPLGPAEALIERVRSLPYVSVVEAGSMEISFGPERRFDAESSQDQAFGANRVYGADNGDLAVSFSLFELDADEVASIARSPAEWAQIQI